MPRPPNTESDSHVPQQGGLGYLARFMWMLIGPGVAAISLLLLFQNRQGGFSSADAVLWCAVAACIGLRYIDVSRLNGLKASGEPASIVDWRRYAVIFVIVALVLWGIARRVAILQMLRG
ncbi:MAG TPA: hypothetical protein VMV94_12420 [Phycisphaerae bacterium]|nr:hypothetical protein [Phycisphaerae bacterium]